MKKNIIKISLSISIIVMLLAVSVSKALTLDDIYMLLNSEIINPTQASILMQNSYMFGGPIPSMEVAPKQVVAAPIITCVTINSSLKYSDRDTSANGNAVTLLQSFLNKNGFLPTEPTGFFGELTLIGVKAFQAVNGIDATGFVGPITRAKIKNVDCDNVTIPTSGISTDPKNPPIPNKPDSIPPIISFVATPDKVNLNENVSLFWSVENVTGKCTITSKDYDGKVLNATVDNFSESTEVGPITKPISYTLVCYNKYGIPGSKTININLKTTPVSSNQGYIKAGVITSVIPTNGNRGDIVTIQGNGFLPNDYVIFDGSMVEKTKIISQGSTSISFIVPDYQLCPTGYCPTPAEDTNIETGGKKTIQISGINGYSNDASFTLASNIIIIKGNTIPIFIKAQLTISTSTPVIGNRGDTVILKGTGFANDSVVMFGGFKIPSNFVTSKSNTEIYFTVPPFQIGCTDPELEECPRIPLPGSGTVVETGGDKTITIINTNSKATTTSVMFSLPSKKITY